MINEDLHGDSYNCALGYNGLIIVLHDIEPGTELVTRYGNRYNWDALKNEALAGLRDEFDAMDLDIDMDWRDMVEARESKNPLCKWAAKLVDGGRLRRSFTLLIRVRIGSLKSGLLPS